MPFGPTLSRGLAWPDRGWKTHPGGLADFAGHSLKGGAPEIIQVTGQDREAMAVFERACQETPLEKIHTQIHTP